MMEVDVITCWGADTKPARGIRLDATEAVPIAIALSIKTGCPQRHPWSTTGPAAVLRSSLAEGGLLTGRQSDEFRLHSRFSCSCPSCRKCNDNVRGGSG